MMHIMSSDYKTSSDLQKLEAMLERRGYGDGDIDRIFHGNWLRFFTQWLPA